jgi:hypothetical protein
METNINPKNIETINEVNNNKITKKMNARNFLRNVSAAMLASFVAILVGFSSCTADGTHDLNKETIIVPGDTVTIVENGFINETLTDEGRGTETINGKDKVDSYCSTDGDNSLVESKTGEYYARINVSGNRLIYIGKGSLPNPTFKAGTFESYRNDWDRKDNYSFVDSKFGTTSIDNTFSKTEVCVMTCKGDTCLIVGYVNGSGTWGPIGEVIKDTIIDDYKYEIRIVNYIITDQIHTGNRDYDAVFEIPFRVLTDVGAVIIDYGCNKNTPWTDNCSTYSWKETFFACNDESKSTTLSVVVPTGRTLNLGSTPSVINISCGETLNLNAAYNGEVTVATGGSQDSISWTGASRKYCVKCSDSDASFFPVVSWGDVYSWRNASQKGVTAGAPSASWAPTGNTTTSTVGNTTVKTTPIRVTVSVKFTDGCSISESFDTVLKETCGNEEEIKKSHTLTNLTFDCNNSGTIKSQYYENGSLKNEETVTLNNLIYTFDNVALGNIIGYSRTFGNPTFSTGSESIDRTKGNNGSYSANNYALTYWAGTLTATFQNGYKINVPYVRTSIEVTRENIKATHEGLQPTGKVTSAFSISSTVKKDITENNVNYVGYQSNVSFELSFATCKTTMDLSGWFCETKVVEDVITWKLIENVVTGVTEGGWTYNIKEEKYVNGVATGVYNNIPGNGPWGYSLPNVLEYLVNSFSVNNGNASQGSWALSGSQYKRTFTNNVTIDGVSVTNAPLGFIFWSNKVMVTLSDGTSIEAANVKDVLSFTDNGIDNPLTTISTNSRGLYSNLNVAASAFSYSQNLKGNAILNLKEDEPTPTPSEAVLTPHVSWDYNNNYHITVAVIQDGKLEIYLDPSGSNVTPVCTANLSDLRIDPTGQAVAAYQTANGQWHAAIVSAGNASTEYYALETSKYTKNVPNRRILDNHAHTKWGGHKWSGFITNGTENANGTYTIAGYVQLLSLDNNVKGTKTFDFTTNN